MKKLKKLALVILTAGSFSFSSVVAGELSVTGGVTATYGMGEAASGLGVSNELTFGATGELDNGFTWSYAMELDTGTTTGSNMNNDDTALVIGTPYGNVGVFMTEGGLSSKYAYGAGALAAGSDYSAPADITWSANIDSYNNVQYHTPAGLLPFGLTAKVGYAPNLSDPEGTSAKNKGAVETAEVGGSLTQYRIDASPLEGLTVGADYAKANDTLASTEYAQESGSAYFKYVAGPVTIGFSRTGNQPTKTDPGATVTYETDAYGIKFAVNENFTISYGEEKSTKRTSSTLDANSVRTVASEVNYEIEHIQAAYVIGGATVGIAIADGKNVAYTAGRQDKQTIFSLAMAF